MVVVVAVLHRRYFSMGQEQCYLAYRNCPRWFRRATPDPSPPRSCLDLLRPRARATCLVDMTCSCRAGDSAFCSRSLAVTDPATPHSQTVSTTTPSCSFRLAINRASFCVALLSGHGRHTIHFLIGRQAQETKNGFLAARNSDPRVHPRTPRNSSGPNLRATYPVQPARELHTHPEYSDGRSAAADQQPGLAPAQRQ